MTTSTSNLLQLRELLLEEAAPTCRENLLAEVADVERRLLAARAYECQPPQVSGDMALIYERSVLGPARWQLVTGDSLDELEAKLTAALQSVRDARSLGIAATVDYVPA